MSGSVEWELRRLWRIVVSVPSEKTTQPDSLQKVSLLEDNKSGWVVFWEVYKQGFEMGYGEAVHESCGSKQENKEGGKNGREV